MITSETASGLTRARASSSRITVAPRSGAGVLASVPPNLPIAVRNAPAMTMSVMRSSVERMCCDEVAGAMVAHRARSGVTWRSRGRGCRVEVSRTEA